MGVTETGSKVAGAERFDGGDGGQIAEVGRGLRAAVNFQLTTTKPPSWRRWSCTEEDHRAIGFEPERDRSARRGQIVGPAGGVLGRLRFDADERTFGSWPRSLQ